MKCSILALVILFFFRSTYSQSSTNGDFYFIEDENASLIDNEQQQQQKQPRHINKYPNMINQLQQQRQQAETNDSPINSAIEMIDLVTKLTSQTNEVYKAATKMAAKNGMVADPLTFVPSIIIYGTIKAISYMVSMFIYVSSMIAPWQFDPNAKLSFIDLDSLQNIDYEIISNSVRSVPERSFKLLDIREEECKSRAMCEIGQHIHSYWPRVATYIRLAVEQLNVNDNNTGAMLRGLGWADCQSTYRQSCPRSPFSKFYQILYSLNKLLYS